MSERLSCTESRIGRRLGMAAKRDFEGVLFGEQMKFLHIIKMFGISSCLKILFN